MKPTPEERVREGIVLLDITMPGWANRINVDRLDMDSCALCVLGQLFDDYQIGLEVLDLKGGASNGFNCDAFTPQKVQDADMKRLNALWTAEILSRQVKEQRTSREPAIVSGVSGGHP